MNKNDPIGFLDTSRFDVFCWECPNCKRIFRRVQEVELVIRKNPSGIDNFYCPDDGAAVMSVVDPKLMNVTPKS